VLVYGLVQSTVEAQREAARLAAALGAILDSATSASHAGSMRAFERLGRLSASLGELKRADLVLFWGCDPDRDHPGFVDRHAPARGGRIRLAVDLGEARGPAAVDERLALPPERELESLLVLRAFVRGRRIEAAMVASLGLSLEALRALARRLKGCAYGVVVNDADPPPGRRDPELAEALTALVRDAHGLARLRLFGLRQPGNPVGAESVFAWQTRFPAAIRFAHDGPRYGPGEWSGEAALASRDVDAALVVGAEPGEQLSRHAIAHLARIPRVHLGGPDSTESERAAVFIATAPLAATAGSVFRMDGVALRQRVVGSTSALPTQAAVLSQIGAAVASRQRRVPE